MKIRLSNEEIRKYLEIDSPEFPKYTTQLLNLANQNAQGTRPRIVGQMSELIQHFTGQTLVEWEQWYLERNPGAIRMATEKVLQMVENLRDAIEKIDRRMVEEWVRDLVIIKTFMGLRFQEAILKEMCRNRRCGLSPLRLCRGIERHRWIYWRCSCVDKTPDV
jgi:hypothetical protein